jgi:hypothetical protein
MVEQGGAKLFAHEAVHGRQDAEAVTRLPAGHDVVGGVGHVGDISVKGVVGESGFQCATQMGVALAVGCDGIIAGSELAGDVGVDRHVVEIALAAVDKEGVGVRPGEDEV